MEVFTWGRRATRDGLMPCGEAGERSSSRNRRRSRQQSSEGVRRRRLQSPYFTPEAPRPTSRSNHQPARQTRPARNLPKFCAYPLGIVRKRPYDGGLSFLAQMQIGAEGGV